jgi:2-octaprenyl-3-methyl-6-methoxy-1,4-benzoquinol hydroxylase
MRHRHEFASYSRSRCRSSSEEIALISRHDQGMSRPVASGAFPLTRRHAQQYVQPGLVLVGDAAHHSPAGGQGVNLGYVTLMRCWMCWRTRAASAKTGPVCRCCNAIRARRRVDNLLMQSGMDLFYAGFSNDLAPLRVLRNVGLMAQRAGVLKRQALKYALGV